MRERTLLEDIDLPIIIKMANLNNVQGGRSVGTKEGEFLHTAATYLKTCTGNSEVLGELIIEPNHFRTTLH